MASAAKDNLMNSLMGNSSPDEDLFGSVPVDPSSTTTGGVEEPTNPNLLAASGLLVGENTGGLFDAVDHEEQTRKQQQQQEEEAQARQQQQALQAEQERQMQEQMQSVVVGTTQPPPMQYQNTSFPMNNAYAASMQQQQQSTMQSSNMQQPNMQQSAMQQSNMQSSAMQQPNMKQSAMTMQPSAMQQSTMQQPNMQQSVMQQSNMQQSNMQQQPGMTFQQPGMMSSPPTMMSPNNTMMMQSQTMQQSMMQPGMMHQSTPNGRFYQSPPRGAVHGGLYGLPPHILQQTAVFDRVLVSEPLLLNGNTSFLGIGQPPHWSYQITTTLKDNTSWVVRRRFRHVVALEDRLRENCPGAILPPRPDKHATRAIEEASAHQSAEFAVQRAAELQVYFNQLIQHPIASTSIVLRLFLALQDDLGTAWPECSSNALTRLANASVGAAVKVSESTANLQSDASEDNAELLALQNAESSRIGAVLQAVPKMEGAVTLLREHAEESLAVGMEFSRVAKEAAEAQPMDVASSGLLRTGRRSKRLGLELSAALQSFSHQYKLCRYERMAFADRRAAIARRHKERHRVDQRASQMMHNHQFGLAQSTAMMDDMAHDAGHECEEIGQRLKAEVHRVAQTRRAEWSASVKIVASAMKEALTERVAIWESVQENFYQTYPEFKPPVDGPGESQQLQH